MISSAIKNFANENNLKISSGVAYGTLYGYVSTLSEEDGNKRLVIATKLPSPQAERNLRLDLEEADVEREYRIEGVSFHAKSIEVTFQKKSGVMKKIEAFIDWFYPLLKQAGASNCKVCAECGQIMEKSSLTLINDVAYPMHKDCAARIRNAFVEEHETERAKEKGSYLTGFIGGVIGSAIGSILWAVLYYFGYVASLAGLVIGLLAEKGYRMFGGKKGGVKVFILIVCIIFGILLGTFAADWYVLYEMLGNGELPGYTAGDLVSLIIEMFKTDEELRMATAKDLGLGLLFAAIGVFALLKRTVKEAKPTKVKKPED